jgi:hypothetical protein
LTEGVPIAVSEERAHSLSPDVVPFDRDMGYTSTVMSEQHANPYTLIPLYPTALATARSGTDDPIPGTCKFEYHTVDMTQRMDMHRNREIV